MWIAVACIALLIVWLAIGYNLLVRARNLVSEAWSGIDVQLKRRHDLIPNLVDAVKAYSSHERDLFDGLAQTRATSLSSDSIPTRSEAENALSGQLKTLLAIAEAYPELKASTNFLGLQKSLSETEDDIQYARRYYNAAVRDFNIRVQSFPGLLIAKLFGFQCAQYFEIEFATERQAPDAKLA
jgi:LemA protein